MMIISQRIAKLLIIGTPTSFQKVSKSIRRLYNIHHRCQSHKNIYINMKVTTSSTSTRLRPPRTRISRSPPRTTRPTSWGRSAGSGPSGWRGRRRRYLRWRGDWMSWRSRPPEPSSAAAGTSPWRRWRPRWTSWSTSSGELELPNWRTKPRSHSWGNSWAVRWTNGWMIFLSGKFVLCCLVCCNSWVLVWLVICNFNTNIIDCFL